MLKHLEVNSFSYKHVLKLLVELSSLVSVPFFASTDEIALVWFLSTNQRRSFAAHTINVQFPLPTFFLCVLDGHSSLPHITKRRFQCGTQTTVGNQCRLERIIHQHLRLIAIETSSAHLWFMILNHIRAHRLVFT